MGSRVSILWVVMVAVLMFDVGLLCGRWRSARSMKMRRLEADLRLLDEVSRPKKSRRLEPKPDERFDWKAGIGVS